MAETLGVEDVLRRMQELTSDLKTLHTGISNQVFEPGKSLSRNKMLGVAAGSEIILRFQEAVDNLRHALWLYARDRRVHCPWRRGFTEQTPAPCNGNSLRTIAASAIAQVERSSVRQLLRCPAFAVNGDHSRAEERRRIIAATDVEWLQSLTWLVKISHESKMLRGMIADC